MQEQGLAIPVSPPNSKREKSVAHIAVIGAVLPSILAFVVYRLIPKGFSIAEEK